MTPSKFRLRRLTIEAFRGFRDAATLDLDASTIIFTGPNGTGKTSVFDALQWVMLGSIERLEGLRSRKNVEHIVNSYRAGERASVALDVVVDGYDATIQRRGNYSGSTLEITGADTTSLFGDEAEDWLGRKLIPHDPKALGMALTTRGLLQQDVIRSVLEAKATDRYAHVSAVLGLGDLEGFEQAAQVSAKEAGVSKTAAEQKLLKASKLVEVAALKVETLKQRATQRTSVEVAWRTLRGTLKEASKRMRVEVPDVMSAEQVLDLAKHSRQLGRRVGDLLETAHNLRKQKKELAPAPSPDQLEQLDGAIKEAFTKLQAEETELQQATAVLSSAEKASQEMARLAAASIPLLTNQCPVCRQSIDPLQVEERLREVTTDTSTLVEFRQSVETADEKVQTARMHGQALQDAYALARTTADQRESVRKNENSFIAEVAELTSDSSAPIALPGLSDDEIEHWGPKIAESLGRLSLELETYRDVVAESQATGEIDRAESELLSAQNALKSLHASFDQVSLRATRLMQLSDAAKKARVDVTTVHFEAIEPLVRDIYSRLDPHPAFKMIGFEHDMYYGKGTSIPVVRDIAAGVKADPLIVFSASQANIAALSYFLAMSLGAGERALPFVLLDDPLHSMDDVNVLGFADLCRFLRADRQLVLSTHDRRFANLLCRKLAPRHPKDRTVIHRFTGWDRSGPSMETELLVYEASNAKLRLVQRPA